MNKHKQLPNNHGTNESFILPSPTSCLSQHPCHEHKKHPKPKKHHLSKDEPTKEELLQRLPTREEILNRLPSKLEFTSHLPTREEILNRLPSKEELVSQLPMKQEILNHFPTRDEIMAHLPSHHLLPTKEEFLSKTEATIQNRLPTKQDIVKHLPTKEDVIRQLPYRDEIFRHLPSKDDLSRSLPTKEELFTHLPSKEELFAHLPSKEEWFLHDKRQLDKFHHHVTTLLQNTFMLESDKLHNTFMDHGVTCKEDIITAMQNTTEELGTRLCDGLEKDYQELQHFISSELQQQMTLYHDNTVQRIMGQMDLQDNNQIQQRHIDALQQTILAQCTRHYNELTQCLKAQHGVILTLHNTCMDTINTTINEQVTSCSIEEVAHRCDEILHELKTITSSLLSSTQEEAEAEKTNSNGFTIIVTTLFTFALFITLYNTIPILPDLYS